MGVEKSFIPSPRRNLGLSLFECQHTCTLRDGLMCAAQNATGETHRQPARRLADIDSRLLKSNST